MLLNSIMLLLSAAKAAYRAMASYHSDRVAFLKEKCVAGFYCIHGRSQEFLGLQQAGFQHVARPHSLRIDLRKGAKSVLPLADRAIGNLQQWLVGTYHGVSRDQLQVYLDEFVFRHNRRKQPMAALQTLLGLGTWRKPTAYRRIRGGTDLSRPGKTPSQPVEFR
jgi:hypothetical protein